jgi:OOP family OmpA-OmpF porin
MNFRARWIRRAVLSAALSLFASAPASAQPRAEGFALNRFEPSERGSDWFVLESLDLRGGPRFAAGLVLDYAHRPLMLYSAVNGEEIGSVVEHQLFAHLGASVVLWDRVRFGLNLPIALAQDGDGGSTDTATFSSDNATTIGDLRLSADARLFGNYGEPITLGGGLQLFAPTGSQTSFTSDGAVRVAARFMAAGEIGQFVYASMLGFNIRANDEAVPSFRRARWLRIRTVSSRAPRRRSSSSSAVTFESATAFA